MDDSLPLTESNFTPYLLRAKNAGCDAIFRNGSDTTGLSILKAARNQGMQDVDFLFDASSYTAQLAKSASPLGMRVYLASEFEPYTETQGANADWIATAERGRINETAFTQGAYVSAKWLIEVLRSIKGDITRQTVLAAMKAGKPYNNPMVGSPLVMGGGQRARPQPGDQDGVHQERQLGGGEQGVLHPAAGLERPDSHRPAPGNTRGAAARAAAPPSPGVHRLT